MLGWFRWQYVSSAGFSTPTSWRLLLKPFPFLKCCAFGADTFSAGFLYLTRFQ